MGSCCNDINRNQSAIESDHEYIDRFQVKQNSERNFQNHRQEDQTIRNRGRIQRIQNNNDYSMSSVNPSILHESRRRMSISNQSLANSRMRLSNQISQQIQQQSQRDVNIDFDTIIQMYMDQRLQEGHQPNNLIMILALLRALQNTPQNQGLTKQQIKSLTKKKAQNSQSDCPVCQDCIKKGDQMLILTCNHPYHVECITEWLQKSNKCPLCRKQTVISNSS